MPWYFASSLIVAVFLAFALTHSLCVLMNIKNIIARFFGENFVKAFYRLFYNTFSFLTTAVAVYLMLLIPDTHLFTAPAWLRWPMHGIQLLGLLTGIKAFGIFDTFEFLGIKQAWRYLSGKEVGGDIEGIQGNRLVKSGIYNVVRNPMYLGGIMIFTFNPHITVNGLTLSILADAYFVFGALMEERRMLMRYGNEYREYMSETPLIIPRIKTLTKLVKASMGLTWTQQG